VEDNRHNSITSTYYLIIKNKKREVVAEQLKNGRRFDDVFKNEKQQLMNLLKDLGTGPKKQNTKKQVEEESSQSPDNQLHRNNNFNLKPIKIPSDSVD
jgi:hypothetical protein